MFPTSTVTLDFETRKMHFVCDRDQHSVYFRKSAPDGDKVKWTSHISYTWPSNKPGWSSMANSHAEEKTALHLYIVGEQSFCDHVQLSRELFEKSKTYEFAKKRIHLLKSNIQKAVRLNYPDTILRTMYAILNSNHQASMLNMIKRWFIVPTEDGTFTPFLGFFLFYFLAMQQSYVLTPDDKLWLLYCCAISGGASTSPDVMPADWRCRFAAASSDASLDFKLDDVTHQLIIESCAIKASFGGLSGDMNLLADVRNAFVARYKRESPYPKWFQSTVTTYWMKPADLFVLNRIVDWTWNPQIDQILTAVDMHCTPLVEYLQHKYNISNDKETERKLKSLIWDRRSGLRIRPCTCGKHADDEIKSGKGNILPTEDPEWWKLCSPELDKICEREWNENLLSRWSHSRNNIVHSQQLSVPPMNRKRKATPSESLNDAVNILTFFQRRSL